MTFVGSPNYTQGRQGKKPDRIVVHWIVGKLSAADAVFKNPASEVSAHYGIGNNVIHQYVVEQDTAWHAGNWDMNLRSIGIEHEGGPNLPISEETYQTSANLIREISQRHNIPIDKNHIIPHRDIKPTQCPGTLDLDKLISLATGGETKFDELVRKSTNHDIIVDSLKVDKSDAKSGEKVLKIFEDQKNELQSCRTSAQNDKDQLEGKIRTLEEEVQRIGQERDEAVSKVCSDPNAHPTGDSGDSELPAPLTDTNNNNSGDGDTSQTEKTTFLSIIIAWFRNLFKSR
jgi:N-acetylmuramoyl-L-alanine amidase CwlA